ncbi:MAG: PQQ-dependent sugar dehydrogenase [Flavobacteriales bacterium]
MRAITTFCFSVIPFTLLLAQPAVSVQLQTVASGRIEPVAITNAGDPRLFIVERAGRIFILNPNGSWVATPFLDITDRVNDGGGEQGLLGLAFHPDYASNGYFYVHYSGGTGVGNSRISRFTVSADPNDAVETSEFFIWSATQPGPNTNHRGGDLHFGPDGNLWFGLGDAGGSGDPSNYAQNLTVPFGKMLRIDVDGGSPYAIPADNPYVGAGGGILPEIWARGLRNPWRFSLDELTGDVWIGDVGQGVWEEIDRWPGNNNSGPDFGWRCYEGTGGYNTAGCGAIGTYDAPVAAHNHTDSWCAIVGGQVYRGNNFTRLTGRYIYTDWCLGNIYSLTPNGPGWTQELLCASGISGLAAFGENMNGELYVVNQQSGFVYRIVDPYAVVRVSPKVFLEGPYDNAVVQMRDDLRAATLIPVTEPYSGLGFQQEGWGGETIAAPVLAVTGANAIVDWVRIELRQSGSPGTIAASVNALVQRDGDVVSTDGVSPVEVIDVPGNYHVAIRHRNHLGCMTSGTLALTATTTALDFRSNLLPVYGANARKAVGAQLVLWAGNTVRDTPPPYQIKYTGTANDRDPILVAVGGTLPTASIMGYHSADVTMDGVVKYTGSLNDRDPILVNVGGTTPTATRTEQLP